MLHSLCFAMSIGGVFGDEARVLSVKGIVWDRIGWNILHVLFLTIMHDSLLAGQDLNHWLLELVS